MTATATARLVARAPRPTMVIAAIVLGLAALGGVAGSVLGAAGAGAAHHHTRELPDPTDAGHAHRHGPPLGPGTAPAPAAP